MKIHNGDVVVAPNFMRGIVQWLHDDQWVLLSAPVNAAHGGTCMIPTTEIDHPSPFYTEAELKKRLRRWKKIQYQAELERML